MDGDTVTVYDLSRQSDKLLFRMHTATGFGDGFYSLTGWPVETRKTVHEAREAIGISIPPDEALFSYFIHRKTPKGVFLYFIFEASACRDSPRICNPDMASDLAFFYTRNLPENTMDDIWYTTGCIQRSVRTDCSNWRDTKEGSENEHKLG